MDPILKRRRIGFLYSTNIFSNHLNLRIQVKNPSSLIGPIKLLYLLQFPKFYPRLPNIFKGPRQLAQITFRTVCCKSHGLNFYFSSQALERLNLGILDLHLNPNQSLMLSLDPSLRDLLDKLGLLAGQFRLQ